MSKSRGNVVNPDDIVAEYGADTMRLYEMFIGDFEKAAPWSSSSIKGCKRFLDRVWALGDALQPGAVRPELEGAFHKTVKKVTEDIESLKMNTAIAALMTLLNALDGKVTEEEWKIFLTLLNPFAPHITEELWVRAGFAGELNAAPWPKFDPAKCLDETVEIAIQILGKVRARINVAAAASKDEVLALAKAEPSIAAQIAGKTIVKEIVVPGKLVNLVIR
ncbi:MAG: class I tRNA ligase family protein, partial [Clostridia bacterium]|nr:class I tRNA ligase family protein [Clostridia bacterium]